MKKFWLLFLIVFCLLGCGCTRVDPGNVGIKVNMSGTQKGVEQLPLQNGWNGVRPSVETNGGGMLLQIQPK